MRALIILLALAAAASPARADVHRRKVATTLSAAGAGVSAAVMLTSFVVTDQTAVVNRPLFGVGLATSIVTPSLGEFYAHQYLTIGEGLRVGAAALALVAVTRTHDVTCDTTVAPGQICTELDGSSVAILGVAAIAYIAGAVYDISDAGDSVDRYDNRPVASVAPMLVPGGGGLAVIGRW